MTGARPFDLVIFDLDGTLADTLPDITAALNATLAEANLPPLPSEIVVQYVGDGSAKLIERALPPEQAGRDLAPLLARFLTHYEERPCVDSRLYPGVTTMLETLAEAKVGVAVVTNKLGSVARRLLDQLLPGYGFVSIVGDGDGFPRKPDPAAARALIARVGTTTLRTAVVGDGLPDVRMGRALSATAIAAAWGYVPREQLAVESPTWLVASPAEALRLLVGA